MASSGERIRLNVGGRRFETTRTTLRAQGDSMLATLISDQWIQENPDQELFIDRDGRHFHLVLNYLRDDNHMALPQDPILLQELAQEAEYYQLPGLRQLCRRLLPPIHFKVGDLVRIRPEAVRGLSQSFQEEMRVDNSRMIGRALGAASLQKLGDKDETHSSFEWTVKCLGCFEKQTGKQFVAPKDMKLPEPRECPLAELELNFWRGSIQIDQSSCVCLYSTSPAMTQGMLHVSKALVIPD